MDQNSSSVVEPPGDGRRCLTEMGVADAAPEGPSTARVLAVTLQDIVGHRTDPVNKSHALHLHRGDDSVVRLGGECLKSWRIVVARVEVVGGQQVLEDTVAKPKLTDYDLGEKQEAGGGAAYCHMRKKDGLEAETVSIVPPGSIATESDCLWAVAERRYVGPGRTGSHSIGVEGAAEAVGTIRSSDAVAIAGALAERTQPFEARSNMERSP